MQAGEVDLGSLDYPYSRNKSLIDKGYDEWDIKQTGWMRLPAKLLLEMDAPLSMMQVV